MAFQLTLSKSYYRSSLLFCMLLMFGLGTGCDQDTNNDQTTNIEFPDKYKDQGLHCFIVLSMHLEQIKSIAGEGQIGKWVSSDVSDAYQSAMQSAHSSGIHKLAGDESTKLIRGMMNKFDLDNDGKMSGQRERKLFGKHVDRCMELFASKAQQG